MLFKIPVKLSITLVRGYQKTLSPDHGLFKVYYPQGYCRFQPSCSSYAVEALEIHGFWKGWYLAIVRVLRCHPFAKGGADPVPKKNIPDTLNNV